MDTPRTMCHQRKVDHLDSTALRFTILRIPENRLRLGPRYSNTRLQKPIAADICRRNITDPRISRLTDTGCQTRNSDNITSDDSPLATQHSRPAQSITHPEAFSRDSLESPPPDVLRRIPTTTQFLIAKRQSRKISCSPTQCHQQTPTEPADSAGKHLLRPLIWAISAEPAGTKKTELLIQVARPIRSFLCAALLRRPAG